MAQPPPYDRSYNFNDYQAENPLKPLPADKLDEEFSRVKTTLDAVLQNLKLIQRDDTALANKSVGYDQLKDELDGFGFNPPTEWAPETNYIVRDTVFYDAGFYRCLESHVSSADFEADLNAGLWAMVADFTIVQTTAIAARDAALQAQADAEDARDAALLAQSGAESARDAAIGAKDDALLAKSGAESARDAAVVAKGLAEAAQAGAEQAQADAEEAEDAVEQMANEIFSALPSTWQSMRDETIAARDETIAARDETIAARDETIDARDEAIDAKDEAGIYASTAQNARDGALMSISSSGYFPNIAEGMAGTESGEIFWTIESGRIAYYVKRENLYVRDDRREDYYVNSTNGKIMSGGTGWAVSDFIAVEPGKNYTIYSDDTRQAGVSFFASQSDSDVIEDSLVWSSASPLTVMAPEGAAYMVLNVQSQNIPEPDLLTVVEGTVPLLNMAGEARKLVALEGEAGWDQITERIESANLYDPTARRPFYFISIGGGQIQPGEIRPTLEEEWAVTDFIPVEPGKQYTISANATKEPRLAFFSARDDAAVVPGSYDATSTLPLTVTAPEGAAFLVVSLSSATRPEPSQVMINEGAEALPWEPYGGRLVIREDALPGEIATDSKLVLSGQGNIESYVESSRSGTVIRNTFIAFPTLSLLQHPCRFNTRKTYVNGSLMRDAVDDIAPDGVFGTLVDGNHGYILGVCTATGHGKDASDEGSLWSDGANEYVLVQVINANTLALARTDANTAPGTGTFTHVSGATNTGSITVSNVTSNQWYPPHTNYNIRVLVDGKEITSKEGTFNYKENVQFIETYEILARSEIIDWWKNNGGWSGGAEPGGDPSIMRTVTYHFDKDGQLSIYQSWLFLKETPVNALWGLQAMRQGEPEEYYVPGSEPFTYDGNTVNFAMKESSDLTLGGAEIHFNSSNLQDSGEHAHRCVALWPDKVFAIGFLPVADASLDDRSTNTSNLALRIATTAKLYFYTINKGAFTAQPGDFYSSVGYRNVAVRTSDRTDFYTVRTEGAVYVYADWHDKEGIDRLPIPADLTGRDFEVVDSRNATVKAKTLSGSLPVDVDADSDYGYLILKVT